MGILVSKTLSKSCLLKEKLNLVDCFSLMSEICARPCVRCRYGVRCFWADLVGIVVSDTCRGRQRRKNSNNDKAILFLYFLWRGKGLNKWAIRGAMLESSLGRNATWVVLTSTQVNTRRYILLPFTCQYLYLSACLLSIMVICKKK